MTSSAAFVENPRIERRIPKISDVRGVRVHMIGIGGSGMSGLAGVLLRRGARLTGSDSTVSDAVAQLAARGATITTQRAEDLPGELDLIVASAAIAADHSQMVEARRRGIAVMKYAEMLGTLMAARSGIAVSGTHGKSTTTAWLAFILKSAGLDPSFVVGAAAEQLGGSSGVGDGPHFIAEACEFDRSFLNLRPKCAAILNIEEDHLDCYGDIVGIEQAFAEFASLLPKDGLLVINGDDERCRRLAAAQAGSVQSFGLSIDCGWRASDLTISNGCYSFLVDHVGQTLGRVTLAIPGRHNVYNALAVIVMAHWCGLSWGQIQRGLAEFRGARRRMTLCGEVNSIRIIDDYGHHPTEIRATLTALRERYEPKRLWCVFQPHQHSRTRYMLDEFARSLTLADQVILPDIYSARDTTVDREAVSARDLVARVGDCGGKARYIPAFSDIVSHLAAEAEPGDLVAVMGAGNISEVAHVLLERLRGHLSN